MNANKFLLFLLLLSGEAVLAQHGGDQSVPRSVQRNFQRDYPEAGDARWSSSGKEWHADFTDHSRYDRGEMVAHYDQTGRHVDSHIPYDRNDVPNPVIHHVERKYPGGSDYSYTRIERPGAQAVFQVGLSLNGRHTNKYVDDQGRERSYQDHHHY
ncbi:MAG TPA: hypothetical protein VKQ52_02700 [Puia sp.]|nr:hypothetical protein [Puia sp.]